MLWCSPAWGGCPGDALYCFEALELKAANHRLDGALWPLGGESGTPEQPLVLLEVQMQGKPGFKHQLFAQRARFLQLYPRVQHLEVVGLLSYRRLRLGPGRHRLPRQLEVLLAGVHWLSLEALGDKPELDPPVSLLTLPVLSACVEVGGIAPSLCLKAPPPLPIST